MKTIVSFAVLAVSASAALAQNPRIPDVKPVAEPKLKMNFGTDFELKSRKTALPVDRETVEPKALTASQVGRVVKDRVDELEYCWLKVPAAKRSQSSAVVKLSVEAIGIVETVRVDGDLPAGVSKCIATAAARWRFPVGDQAAELEYPIGLHQLAPR